VVHRAVPWHADFLYHGSDPVCDIPPRRAPSRTNGSLHSSDTHLPRPSKHPGTCGEVHTMKPDIFPSQTSKPRTASEHLCATVDSARLLGADAKPAIHRLLGLRRFLGNCELLSRSRDGKNCSGPPAGSF